MPFRDVSKPDWFFSDVLYVYERGLMSGTGADTFTPGEKISRGMIATVLYRMAGSPAIDPDNYFVDTKAGEWYSDAAVWAADSRIMSDDGAFFRPNETMSRQDLALTLYRYARYKGWDVSGRKSLTGYADYKDIYSANRDAMSWAVYTGLINGVGNNRLNPTGETVRSDFAALLHRFCQNVKG